MAWFVLVLVFGGYIPLSPLRCCVVCFCHRATVLRVFCLGTFCLSLEVSRIVYALLYPSSGRKSKGLLMSRGFSDLEVLFSSSFSPGELLGRLFVRNVGLLVRGGFFSFWP